MSFILDALKKSEHERRNKSAPEAADVVPSEAPRSRRLWPWIGAGVLASAALGLTVVLWRPEIGGAPPSTEAALSQRLLEALESLEARVLTAVENLPRTTTPREPIPQPRPEAAASLPPPSGTQPDPAPIPKEAAPRRPVVESTPAPPTQPNAVKAEPAPPPTSTETTPALPPQAKAVKASPAPPPTPTETTPALPPQPKAVKAEPAPPPTPTEATPALPPQPKAVKAAPAPPPTPTETTPAFPPQAQVAKAEPAPPPTPTETTPAFPPQAEVAKAEPAPAPDPDLSKKKRPEAPVRVSSATIPGGKVVRATGTALAHVKRGQAYEDEGLLDRALEEYTQAILLKPNYAEAYLGRGWIHHSKGSRRLAVKNFSQAIQLKPRNPEAYFGRAWAYEQLGQVDLAIKEYGQAILLKDDYADAYLSRGILRFYHGRPDTAAADFSVVLDKAPDDLRRYAVLWLYLSRARSGGDGTKELSALAKTLPLTPWPGIIVSLYMGKATAEQVLAAITDEDRKTRLEKESVAFYFLGQHHLVRGDRERAVEHFRKILATGVTAYRQYGAAEKELRRMGVTP